MKKSPFNKTIFISLIVLSSFSAIVITYIDCQLSTQKVENVQDLSSVDNIENNKIKFIIGLFSKVNKTIKVRGLQSPL